MVMLRYGGKIARIFSEKACARRARLFTTTLCEKEQQVAQPPAPLNDTYWDIETRKCVAVSPITILDARLPRSSLPSNTSVNVSWTRVNWKCAPPECLEPLFRDGIHGFRSLLSNGNLRPEDIVSKLIQVQMQYTPTQLINACHTLERFGYINGSPVLRQLRIGRRGVDTLSPETLGMLSSLCKNIGIRSATVTSNIMQRCTEVLSSISGPDLCRVLAYLAFTGRSNPEAAALSKKIIQRLRHVGRHSTITELAAGLNAVTRLKMETTELTQSLCNYVAKKLRDGGPKEMALILHSFSQCNSPALALCSAAHDSISATWVSSPQLISQRDVAMVCHALARLEYRNLDCFASLSSVIQSGLHSWTMPRDLASVAYAFGKLSIPDTSLMVAVADRSIPFLKRFRNQDLAWLVYGLTELRIRHRKAMEAIADEVLYRCTLARKNNDASQLKPEALQSSCLLLRGFAVLGLHDVRIIVAVTDTIKEGLALFTTSEALHAALPSDAACSLFDSVSRTCLRLVPFLDTLTSSLVTYGKMLTTQSAASVLRSCAHLQYTSPRLVNFLMKELQRLLPSMTPSCARSTLLSMSALSIYQRHYIKTALQQIASHFDTAPEPSTLVDLVDALRALRFRDVRWLTSVIPNLTQWTDEMSVHQLCTLLQSFVELRINAPNLYRILCYRIFLAQHELNITDAIKLVNVFARSDRLVRLPRPDDCNESNAIHVPWKTALLETVLEIIYAGDAVDLPVCFVLDVARLRLVLETEDPFAVLNLPLALREATYRTATLAQTLVQTTSPVKEPMKNNALIPDTVACAVRRCLRQLKVPFEEDVLVGGYRIPFVVDRMTLLELDGSDQFYRDTCMRTATSLLRLKILNHICDAGGLRIERIHYLDWAQCVTMTEKTRFCAELLRQHCTQQNGK